MPGKPSQREAPTPPEVVERVWAKVDVRGEDDCWEFTGQRNYQGYGLIRCGAHKRLAHRVASESIAGAIPVGICVLHHCDNPPCCNPRHHFRGTRADNIHDAHRKGRLSPPPVNDVRGERNGHAKLTWAKVAEIRLRAGRGEGVGKIARDFSVSHSLVSMIVSGKRWVVA